MKRMTVEELEAAYYAEVVYTNEHGETFTRTDMTRMNIDMDLCDDVRILVRENVDLYNRGAVEASIGGYKKTEHGQHFYNWYVDRCINEATYHAAKAADVASGCREAAAE
jgi:hypothetical protein